MVNPRDRVNQIAFQLGLKRPEDYQAPSHAEERGRALGRTTHTILWALADVVQGTAVCFMAPTKELAARMVYQARDYARQLGLDTTLIRRPLPYGVESITRYWPKGVKVFRDHTLNRGGGVILEPRRATSSGHAEGFSIECPWCGKTIKEPFPDSQSVHQDLEFSMHCPGCFEAVLLHVDRVRIFIKAWRVLGPRG